MFNTTTLFLQSETSQQLDWLKTVLELHGSVEKSSLTQAKKINNKGFYKIGGEVENIPTLENCLKVILPNQNRKIGLCCFFLTCANMIFFL